MANQPQQFHAPGEGGAKQWVPIAVGLLLLLAAAWYVYKVLSDVSGVQMKSVPATEVNMLPPPPPPPPPPPQQPKPPEPQDKPEPVPQQPSPDKPAPAPMQINGPAQAGGDAYGLSAGSGGGMGSPGSGGNCVGPNCGRAPAGTDRFWGRAFANDLEDYLENKGKLNVDAFVGEFDVWVDGSGAVTRAALARSSGNAKLDQQIQALLQTARGLKAPPASIRMPQRMKIGRKRF